MDSWVYFAVAGAVVALVAIVGLVLWARHVRRSRREFAEELLMSTGEMRDLAERVNALLAHNSIQPAAPPRHVSPVVVEQQQSADEQRADEQRADEQHPLVVATLTELGAEDPEPLVVASVQTDELDFVVEPEPVLEAVILPIPAQRQPRDVEMLSAVVANRPQWLPAKPLRETLIKTASLAHGVRQALSADVRDRIAVEMQLEVRRSRRHRKQEMKALRKYLRGGGGVGRAQ